jgi:hypothetical protein
MVAGRLARRLRVLVGVRGVKARIGVFDFNFPLTKKHRWFN